MSPTQQSALNLLVSAMQMGIPPLSLLRDALNNGNIVVGELDGLVEALRCISSVASELADGAAQLKREEGQQEAGNESTGPQESSYKELDAGPSQLSPPRAPSPPALFDFSGVEEVQAEVLNLDGLDKIFDDFLATTASTITTTTREIIPIIVTPSRIPNQASTTTSHNYHDPRNNHYTGIDGGATLGPEPPKMNIAGLPYADNTTTTTTNDYINGHDHSQDTNTASALTSTSYEDKGKGRATEVDQDFTEGDDTSNDPIDWGSPAVDPLPSTESLDSNDPNSTNTAAAAVLPPPHRHDFPTPASAATLSTKETGLSAPPLPYVGSTSGVDATSALPPSANVAPPPPATMAPPPLPPAKGRKATKPQGESSTQAGPSTSKAGTSSASTSASTSASSSKTKPTTKSSATRATATKKPAAAKQPPAKNSNAKSLKRKAESESAPEVSLPECKFSKFMYVGFKKTPEEGGKESEAGTSSGGALSMIVSDFATLAPAARQLADNSSQRAGPSSVGGDLHRTPSVLPSASFLSSITQTGLSPPTYPSIPATPNGPATPGPYPYILPTLPQPLIPAYDVIHQPVPGVNFGVVDAMAGNSLLHYGAPIQHPPSQLYGRNQFEVPHPSRTFAPSPLGAPAGNPLLYTHGPPLEGANGYTNGQFPFTFSAPSTSMDTIGQLEGTRMQGNPLAGIQPDFFQPPDQQWAPFFYDATSRSGENVDPEKDASQ